MPTGAAARRSNAAEGHDLVQPGEGRPPRAGMAAPRSPEARPDRGGRPAAPARKRRHPSAGHQLELALVGGGAAPRRAPPAVAAAQPVLADHPAPAGRDPGRGAPAAVALPPGLRGHGGRRKAAAARDARGPEVSAGVAPGEMPTGTARGRPVSGRTG
jgi:hypothetical protein